MYVWGREERRGERKDRGREQEGRTKGEREQGEVWFLWVFKYHLHVQCTFCFTSATAVCTGVKGQHNWTYLLEYSHTTLIVLWKGETASTWLTWNADMHTLTCTHTLTHTHLRDGVFHSHDNCTEVMWHWGAEGGEYLCILQTICFQFLFPHRVYCHLIELWECMCMCVESVESVGEGVCMQL